ncbi:MAG: ribonucleotide reductase subunit alpha [Burkholderiales bacterium]|nr:ribonucleotide reductase subunit alpha [Burkholderiales bacterium]
MNISSFDDLLAAARQQPEPQRLLFVFASAELPEDSTLEQAAKFEAGQGGALVPLMCVDKTPEEIVSFTALAEEARQFGQPWALVFVAGMSGSGGRAPSSQDADTLLQRMVEDVKRGVLGSYLPFDAQGLPVRLG